MDLQCCNYCHLPNGFSSKLQSSMTVFHHKFDRMQTLPNMRKCTLGQWQNQEKSNRQEKVGFWPMDELIHHP